MSLYSTIQIYYTLLYVLYAPFDLERSMAFPLVLVLANFFVSVLKNRKMFILFHVYTVSFARSPGSRAPALSTTL